MESRGFPWRCIGGSGRSGTSLLAERIATHPEVVYFQEPFWFCDENRQVMAYLHGEAGPDELRKTLERSLRNVRAGFTEQGDLAMLDRYEGQLPAAILEQAVELGKGMPRFFTVRHALARVAVLAGRRYWIEKTPHNIRNADCIAKVFPDAKIVHVIREPKDICASLWGQDWGPKGAANFVPWYRQVMTEALEARERVPDGQYLVVEMETLVRQPHAELGRVLRFFEIEYEMGWLHEAASWIDPKKAHIGRHAMDLSPRACRYIDAGCAGLYKAWREIANE